VLFADICSYLAGETSLRTFYIILMMQLHAARRSYLVSFILRSIYGASELNSTLSILSVLKNTVCFLIYQYWLLIKLIIKSLSKL
jgi:hypothetical protein